MPFDTHLADRIREYLLQFPKLHVEEKKMFGGKAFLVNGKMCINVSGRNLMCRFDPDLTDTVSGKPGFLPMIMKGKILKGYCLVEPDAIAGYNAFKYWIDLSLEFNSRAKSSKK